MLLRLSYISAQLLHCFGIKLVYHMDVVDRLLLDHFFGDFTNDFCWLSPSRLVATMAWCSLQTRLLTSRLQRRLVRHSGWGCKCKNRHLKVSEILGRLGCFVTCSRYSSLQTRHCFLLRKLIIDCFPVILQRL